MCIACFWHKTFLVFNKDLGVFIEKSYYGNICSLKNTERDENLIGTEYKLVVHPSLKTYSQIRRKEWWDHHCPYEKILNKL